MELQTAIEILQYHQEWRLGKKEDMIYEPKMLTVALDIVLSEVKKFRLGAIKRSDFIITIDDEYCKWEYGFQPINANDISIKDITNVLEEHFNTKMVYAKLVE